MSRMKRVPARLWIVLFALGLRLLLLGILIEPVRAAPDALTSRVMQAYDASEYARLAQNMVEQGVYSFRAQPPYEVLLNRTPGYPALLALLYGLAGGQHDALLIVAVQALLSLASLWLVMGIARDIGGERVALLSGWLYAVAPAAYFMIAQAYTETFFGTALLLALRFGVAVLVQPRRMLLHLLLAALGLGLATTIRASALALIFALLLALWLGRGLNWRTLAQGGAAAALFGAMLLPWYLHNYAVTQGVIFSSIGSFNLLTYNVASVEAQRLNRPYGEVRDALIAEYRARAAARGIAQPNPAQESAIMQEIALEKIAAHPLEAALYQTLDTLNLLRPGYSFAMLVLRDESVEFGANVQQGDLVVFSSLNALEWGVVAAMTAYYGLLYPAFALGVLRLIWQRRAALFVLLVGSSAWLLFSAGYAGNARFRAPVEGILCAVAALGLCWLWEVWRTRRMRPQQA